MTLEFSFDIQPDERGVYDGRELARQLVSYAFGVLVPYVGGCPGCADTLFSQIANNAMAELHEQGRRDGRLLSATYALGPDDDRDERIKAHLEAASATTGAILREAGEHHDH